MRKLTILLALTSALAAGCDDSAKKAEEARVAAEAKSKAAAEEAAQAAAKAKQELDAKRAQVQKDMQTSLDAIGRKGDYLVQKVDKLPAKSKAKLEPAKTAFESAKQAAVVELKRLEGATAETLPAATDKIKAAIDAAQKSLDSFETAVSPPKK